MKVFMYLDDIPDFNIGNTAVALGNFDGVHKGHTELIQNCVRIAKEQGLTPVVFTFLNHPNNVMAGKTVVKNIMTVQEKTEAIEALGIEIMVNTIFNESIMKSMPEDFVKTILVDTLHCKEAVCGFNYSFGYKALGHPEDLWEYGQKYGFEVNVVDDVRVNGVTVSSTLIRKLISEGRLDEYPEYTGRLYSIEGKVLYGQQLGRTIGFPTVNLSLSEDGALPRNGVYITRTYINNEVFNSITNVGNKPSVGKFGKNAETHIFDFDRDVYGKNIKVEFLKMLREEIKFPSIEVLSAEIQRNCIQAREYFKHKD
ncbi:MAG: bifunctional riboflavin kinase/FAD synthetase [Firmicutes bacterium]|nr:bifunctional riboflavin kinase/FAD synthetase [Bacillota bacterium]